MNVNIVHQIKIKLIIFILFHFNKIINKIELIRRSLCHIIINRITHNKIFKINLKIYIARVIHHKIINNNPTYIITNV